MPEFVYVIARDGGCEGFSAPVQATRSKEEAFRLAALMSQTERFSVFEVPLWPQAQATEWFNVKPLERVDA